MKRVTATLKNSCQDKALWMVILLKFDSEFLQIFFVGSSIRSRSRNSSRNSPRRDLVDEIITPLSVAAATAKPPVFPTINAK